MSDDPHPSESGLAGTANEEAEAASPTPRRLRLEQNEEGLARSYANAFQTFTSGEEVVVDFGFNLVRMDGQQPSEDGAEGTVRLDWNQRTVLSYRTAKSLAIDLGRIIRDFERANGEIPVQNAGARPAPAAPPRGDAGAPPEPGVPTGEERDR